MVVACCEGMRGLPMVLFGIFVLGWLPVGVEPQYAAGGYRLPQNARYLILAPKKTRPDQTYKLHVVLYHLDTPSMRVRASLSVDGEEYASAAEVFTQPSTQYLELLVPETVRQGQHKLVVEGLVGTGAGMPVFRNETDLTFDPKYVSLFVQTDRSIYYAEQTVYFRVVGVSTNLKPVTGTMTIYLVDAGGNIVRRWLEQQLNLGVFQNQFDLSYPVKTGNWSLRIDAFGHRYEHSFLVEFWYQRRFEVNVSMPLVMTDTEWGVVGYLFGEHMSSLAATGNASVLLKVRDQNGKFLSGEIRKDFIYMTDTLPFHFTMEEMKAVWGPLADKELFVKGWITDFLWLETQNGTAVTKVIRDTVQLKIIGRKFRTFKPNIPITIYFAVQRPDGTPYASSQNRQVSVQEVHHGTKVRTSPETRIIIPEDGIIRVKVTPDDKDDRVIVRVWHPSVPSNIEEVQMYRYFTQRGRYLSVTTTTDEPRVNEYMVFTIRTTTLVEEISYVIMAAGNILLGDTLRMSSTQKTFAVAISRQMAPHARILAYYMSEGEVITDTLNFHVKDTRLTKASVHLNLGKDFHGDTMEVIGRGHPGSIIMVNGVDYELYHRGAHTFLTEEKVEEEMRSYDTGSQAPYHHRWNHQDDRWEGHVYFTSPSTGMDSLTSIDLAGLVALTDMNLTMPEHHTSCNSSMGLARCPYSGQCFLARKTCDGFFDCSDGFDEATCLDEEPVGLRPPGLEGLHRVSRFYSDVTWLWKTSYIKPNGQTEVKIDVPKDTNPYVISAFVLHPEEGLSLVEEVAQHDATRVFFIGAEAPSACRRGEQIGIRVAVFNFFDERLEIILTLHGSDDYRFVHVDDMGYVSSYNPRTSAGDVQSMLMLEAGKTTYFHFPIVPVIQSGDMTVAISAFSFIDEDYEELTISVTMDGITNGDHTPFLVDLINQGSVIIPDFDSPIDEMFIHPEIREHLYVKGSESATFSVFGDVVSPGFFEPYFTSDTVTGVPDDCAEGYMFDFAVNLQTLRYLQSTNHLSRDDAENALEYMKTILMRQYAYMDDEGAFKMFRRKEKPSVWLTAFVARILHSALVSEWSQDVYVSEEVLNRAVLWLVNKQDPSGYFRETSDVIYDRSMKPISVDEGGVEHEWHIALTAHVAIALATMTRVTGDAKTRSVASKDLAANYLAQRLHDLTDPFQTAITAYALYQADHNTKDQAFIKLQKMARIDTLAYWASEVIEPNPMEIINTVQTMQTRDYFINLGNAVMATSYALKLHLAKNQWEASTPIMKWLQTQRNSLMGFSSSQDTLLALEALTEYALGETNRDIYNLEITLEATASTGWKEVVKLNSSNFATLYEGELPEAYGQMRASAKGTGYAVLQMDFEANVEKMWQVSGPDFKAYDVEVASLRFSGRNSSIMDMTICTRWERPDISPAAGMTVVTLGIPTGFVVARDTIERLYMEDLPGLRRVRFRDGTLILFWDYMTQTRTCLDFRAERWYPVANVSIQYPIIAMEYAETGLHKYTMYEAYTLFHQHICQVCGSFQCPYCPFYNQSPTIPTSCICAYMIALLLALSFSIMELGL